jgi:hypothetical protein
MKTYENLVAGGNLTFEDIEIRVFSGISGTTVTAIRNGMIVSLRQDVVNTYTDINALLSGIEAFMSDRYAPVFGPLSRVLLSDAEIDAEIESYKRLQEDQKRYDNRFTSAPATAK